MTEAQIDLIKVSHYSLDIVSVEISRSELGNGGISITNSVACEK
jgi:hypothetical protein